MSAFYAKMPEDFRNAVEVIKRYCQNEACDYKCSQCPFPLSEIRCKDGLIIEAENHVKKLN